MGGDYVPYSLDHIGSIPVRHSGVEGKREQSLIYRFTSRELIRLVAVAIAVERVSV